MKHIYERDLVQTPLKMYFKIKPERWCPEPSSKHITVIMSLQKSIPLGSSVFAHRFSSENIVGVDLILFQSTLLLLAVGLRTSGSRRSPEKSHSHQR